VVGRAAIATAPGDSSNRVAPGQIVAFSPTVAAVAPGAGIPSGTAPYFDGTTPPRTTQLDSSDQAAPPIDAGTTAVRDGRRVVLPGAGTHHIAASSLGDTGFTDSASVATALTAISPGVHLISKREPNMEQLSDRGFSCEPRGWDGIPVQYGSPAEPEPTVALRASVRDAERILELQDSEPGVGAWQLRHHVHGSMPVEQTWRSRTSESCCRHEVVVTVRIDRLGWSDPIGPLDGHLR
jgi:hypothetical protein